MFESTTLRQKVEVHSTKTTNQQHHIIQTKFMIIHG
jgi:hypothetical protein